MSVRGDVGTTHAEGCFAWGSRHYECALRVLTETEAQLAAEKAHSALLDDQLRRTQGYEADMVAKLALAAMREQKLREALQVIATLSVVEEGEDSESLTHMVNAACATARAALVAPDLLSDLPAYGAFPDKPRR